MVLTGPRRLLVGLLVLSGCANTSKEAPDQIAVTITPLRLIVQALAPTDIRVGTLLPENVSPHAYEPVPSAARAASEATVLIAMDPEVDGWATRLGADEIAWFNTEGMDPHSWLSPQTVREALPRLVSTLCEYFPRHCDQIKARAATFDSDLGELTQSGKGRLGGASVVASGPYLAPFCLAFDVSLIAVVAPVEGVEPSPSDLRSTIEAAAASIVVVGQVNLPERAAEIVAGSSGVPLVRIDPIGNSATESYQALITDIITRLAEVE